MKYLILIHSNPRSREVWESLSDEQRAEGYAYYAALNDELDAIALLAAAAGATRSRRAPVQGAGRTRTRHRRLLWARPTSGHRAR